MTVGSVARAILSNETLRVEIDPGRGADVLSIVHRPTGSELLFSTPWRDRAERVACGASPAIGVDSQARWLEGYRGGWQTLCPNPGPEREIAGGRVGFHADASVVPWTLVTGSAWRAELTTELRAVPIRIDRTLELAGGTLVQRDTLTNLSAEEVPFDYSAHPAFAGALLDGGAAIEAAAMTFTADHDGPGSGLAPGTRHEWPRGRAADGADLALDRIAVDDRASLFGWLSGFSEGRASITRADGGLSVTLGWDASVLPFAWIWKECGATRGYPWFGRARVVAIEPTTVVSSGPDRDRTDVLEPFESRTVELSVTVTGVGTLEEGRP